MPSYFVYFLANGWSPKYHIFGRGLFVDTISSKRSGAWAVHKYPEFWGNLQVSQDIYIILTGYFENLRMFRCIHGIAFWLNSVFF